MSLCPVWMAPFLQVPFSAWHFVRSSLVFGLFARRTWPLALMVSTNQVPFRTSNSKRSGQSSGRLGFWADKVPSLHWSCKLLFFLGQLDRSHFVGLILGQHSPNHTGSFVCHGNSGHSAGLAGQDVSKPRIKLFWFQPDRADAGRHTQDQ